MMKKLFQGLVLALLALTFNMAAIAADKGTAAEATALVKKAIAYMKANGREKAFAEFSNSSGQFRDRDLYITVVGTNGKMFAHGANPRLVDKNLLDIKDGDGKPFVKDYIELASSKGNGWVDFKWPNPITKAIEQKSFYAEKVDDLVIGCGVYK
jgi:signal transduction histidine kinase